MIPFNKPYLHGRELVYIAQSVASGKISGDGIFSKKCHTFLESRYGFLKTLLTTSCTDALEMSAILLDIKFGDEVILPSFTFVSTANAFALRGAKLIFADSTKQHPNIDANHIEELITKNTRAIVVVHYAGMACDMKKICTIAALYDIAVIEDAAQAIDSNYYGKPLGGIGTFGTFSFHETKNIISGEGGALIINNAKYIARAEIIREKGTNRSAFFRGEVDKYNWVDIGSSFLPADTISAYLFAQLEEIDNIQKKRISLWNNYYRLLQPYAQASFFELPHIPDGASNNAHMFYLVCNTQDDRSRLIKHLNEYGIHAVFHYQPLHSSSYFSGKYHGRDLINCNRFSNCLVRLPLYFEMTNDQVQLICELISCFYQKNT